MNKREKIDLVNIYLKYIKRNMICPSCGSKLIINKDKTIWECKDCSYKLLNSELEDNYIFWFCDKCGEFLNTQNGFDSNLEKWICTNCNHENNITQSNVKGICVKCGKPSEKTTFGLCDECFQKTKKKVLNGIRYFIELSPLIIRLIRDLRNTYSNSQDNEMIDDEDENILLEENHIESYPICKSCGASMTEFDGWAWYTCPECGNAVRIIDGTTTWQDEIFGNSSTDKTCIRCGRNMSGGEYVAPWENGNNEDGYIKCPHCGYANFQWDD